MRAKGLTYNKIAIALKIPDSTVAFYAREARGDKPVSSKDQSLSAESKAKVAAWRKRYGALDDARKIGGLAL